MVGEEVDEDRRDDEVGYGDAQRGQHHRRAVLPAPPPQGRNDAGGDADDEGQQDGDAQSVFRFVHALRRCFRCTHCDCIYDNNIGIFL